MEFKTLTVNKDAAESGVWVQHDDETRFLVARLNNRKFQNMFQKLIAPYRRQFESGKLPLEKQEQIMCKCMAETVLLGWEGLTMDGEPIEYSKDMAYTLLTTPGAEEFRDLISAYAGDAETFREQQYEEAEKN